MKEMIITGGAGFTGANFANHFLNNGYRVVVFDNLSRKGSLENLGWLRQNANAGNLEIIAGDVRFPPRHLKAVVERSDALFHFAAQVAVTTSVADPGNDFEVNALGTLNMLELVRESNGKKPVFLYSSTNKVYGGMEDVATVEDSQRYSYKDLPEGVPEDRILDFHSPYGCSKGCADQYVRDYARIYGLRTIVFRQSCIFGYRQFGIEDQGWVAWFVIAAVLNKPLTIFGNGKQVRDVLFIDDLVRAYEMGWNSIEKITGGVYNIGGGPRNTISLLDLLEFLNQECGLTIPATYSDWRPGDQPVYISDIRKARREFGWHPEMEWTMGVRKLVDWVRDNRNMLAGLF
jgi:CDP-paratose 2-epimerase